MNMQTENNELRYQFHKAAADGQIGVLDALLASGYDIDEKNSDGQSAFHISVMSAFLISQCSF